MKTRYSLIALGALMALSQAALAQRGSSGHVNVIYWQAPSILNPYLSGGTKDLESSSLVLEPLIKFNERGDMVAALVAKDCADLTERLAAPGDFSATLSSARLQRRGEVLTVTREPGRTGAGFAIAPIQIGGPPFCTGFGYDQIGSKFTCSPWNSAFSSLQMRFMASTFSMIRRGFGSCSFSMCGE